MVYAIIQVSNGSYSVAEESITDINKAMSRYHAKCSALWNASDVETACVLLADSSLNAVGGCRAVINKKVAPEPESTPPASEAEE